MSELLGVIMVHKHGQVIIIYFNNLIVIVIQQLLYKQCQISANKNSFVIILLQMSAIRSSQNTARFFSLRNQSERQSYRKPQTLFSFGPPSKHESQSGLKSFGTMPTNKQINEGYDKNFFASGAFKKKQQPSYSSTMKITKQSGLESSIKDKKSKILGRQSAQSVIIDENEDQAFKEDEKKACCCFTRG